MKQQGKMQAERSKASKAGPRGVHRPANLELAFWKASRGKRAHADQREFAASLGEELARLRAGLLDGTYPVGNYRRFTVYEPKERVICAAAFRERVLHHALMNVLEPWIEKWLVFDTYACRRGKGQLAAVKRAQRFARKHRYFLKCDIRKFFDSIPHEGVEEMLKRKIKDRRVVSWLMKIVDTYETTPGRGLPIGNLTSQHLANLYLDRLDRFFPSVPFAGRAVCPQTAAIRRVRDNAPCQCNEYPRLCGAGRRRRDEDIAPYRAERHAGLF